MSRFFLSLFVLSSFVLGAQNERVFGLVDNTLVELDPVARDLTEIVVYNFSESLAELTYSPDQCAFFSLAGRVDQPRLVRLERDGTASLVGRLTMPGRTVFTCEAIELDPDTGTLYGAGSLDGQDNFAESIFSIDLQTAECTLIGTLSYPNGIREDADNMSFHANDLLLNDGNPGLNSTVFYRLPLSALVGPVLSPDRVGETIYYRVGDHVVRNGTYLFPTSDRNLYEIDSITLAENQVVQTHGSGDFGGNGLLGMAVAPMLTPGAITLSLCPGDTATVNGEIYTETGTFDQLLTSAAGCDSLLAVEITSRQASRETLVLSLCEEDPVRVNDSIYRTAGTYEQLLIGSNGCDSLLTIEVEEDFVRIVRDTTLCPLATIEFGGGTINEEGFYLDTLPAAGCDSIVSLSVDYRPVATSFLPEDLVVCGEEVAITSPFVDTRWEDGTVGAERRISLAGTYVATARDENGCTVTDSIAIDFNAVVMAYLPNAFSPNDDDVNDFYTVAFGNDGVPDFFEMSVYDRWGGLVYETQTLTPGWDGRKGDTEVAIGEYLVLVEYRFADCGEAFRVQQTVTLVR